jgi:LuxR family maltose regulon positive regulatory protein
VAWFSIDKFDNEPARFFSYLFSAVQTVIQGLGEKLQGQLQGTDSPSPLSLMTAFINEFTSTTSDQWSESGHQLNIVLDDYHSITEPTIHESLDFLLERLPPQMHVVIVTRQDPPLALARLRARGLLTEFGYSL